MIHLAVLGATGKMGRRVVELAGKDPSFCEVSPVKRTEVFEGLEQCDVAIDFSLREATLSHVAAAVKARKPLVIGTTGHTEEELLAIEEASKHIPILHSPNFSLGIALCLDAVSRFGKVLNGAIDVLETHHIHKKDSPSGTAKALAKAAVEGKADKPEVAIRSIREGEVLGEHVVTFACGHETVELKHTVQSRDTFAAGALLAAKFLVGKKPGLYSLLDLYFLRSPKNDF